MSDLMLGRDVTPDEIGTLTLIDLPTPLTINFQSLELQALCPAVAHVQPDIYDMSIQFTADKSIESKSLKLWLVTFRDRRIFAEHLAVEIADTITQAMDDGGATLFDLSVDLVQNIRGGIVEHVTYRKQNL